MVHYNCSIRYYSLRSTPCSYFLGSRGPSPAITFAAVACAAVAAVLEFVVKGAGVLAMLTARLMTHAPGHPLRVLNGNTSPSNPP